MNSSKTGKWIVVLLLVGIIVLAVLWRKQQRQRRERELVGRVPAEVNRIPTGTLPLTGEPQAWEMVNRFPLWEEAPEVGRQTDWRAVRLSHDGQNLYVMLELAYDLTTRAPERQGTFILGQIMMDTDRDASTGVPLGSGEEAMGTDRQITVIARRDDAASPLCVGYYVEDCSGGRPCEQIGEWVTTCSQPGMVGYQGEHVMFAVPLPTLDVELPAEVIFAFEPFGGSGVRQFRLGIR